MYRGLRELGTSVAYQPWAACHWTSYSVRKGNPHLAKSHDTQVPTTCSQGHLLTANPGEILPDSPKPSFAAVHRIYQPDGPQNFGLSRPKLILVWREKARHGQKKWKLPSL